MRTITPTRITLRFNTPEEARAAGEAIDMMHRAQMRTADAYVFEPVKMRENYEPLEDRTYHHVSASVVYTSPQRADAPAQMLMPPSAKQLAVYEGTAETLHRPFAQPEKTHVMIDLETMGTAPGCPVLSIGAVVMTPRGLGAQFYTSMTLEDQEAAGLVVSEDTRRWWEMQSEAARRVFTEPKVPAAEGLGLFAEWLLKLRDDHPKSTCIWGNGAAFDNAVLATVYTKLGLQVPWEYWNDRCYRTLKNATDRRGALLKRTGTHHNALDDARTQAEHAIQLLNYANLWE